MLGLRVAPVASVFEKSYAMFGSILGTWLPFLSIFAATYLTGTLMVGRSGQRSGGVPWRRSIGGGHSRASTFIGSVPPLG
jgi:hypothetical protein